jgi:hypothetical protein
MHENPEVVKDCYANRPADDLQPGDICVAVPFLVTNDVAEPFEAPNLEPEAMLLKARWVRSIVVRIYEELAIVAPIMTSELASDARDFEIVVEAARRDPHSLRLPPLPGEWEEPAVAYLFMPQTVPVGFLMSRRAASMTPEARSIFEQRVARAFQPV